MFLVILTEKWKIATPAIEVSTRSISDCYGSLTHYLQLRKQNIREKWKRRVTEKKPPLALIFSISAHHLDAINQQFWRAQAV
jgi:hypothetical protein